MRASIVICTRDRPNDLAATLRALAADTSTVERDCVVVDNGSQALPAELVSAFAAEAAVPLRVVREPRAGQSRARNRGIAESDGELILFLDDDAQPRPGWADALAEALSDPAIAFAGGRVIPVWNVPQPPWLTGEVVDSIALRDWGPDPVDLEFARLPYGANLALRRSALEASGIAFDVRLGHTGSASMGMDEWHIMRQLLQRHRGCYAPEAIVEHHFAADRITRAAVRQRCYQGGFGVARSLRLLGLQGPRSLPSAVRSLAQAWRAAIRVRRHNDRAPSLEPAAARREFEAFAHVGIQTERVLGRFEGVVDRLSRVRT